MFDIYEKRLKKEGGLWLWRELFILLTYCLFKWNKKDIFFLFFFLFSVIIFTLSFYSFFVSFF